MFDELRFPVIAAPMAGGPTTPGLVAAVTAAGGFGFLAGGYLSAEALADRIAKTAELTGAPFGVNLFVPGGAASADLDGHVQRWRAEAERYGVELGEPRWDDDAYNAKLEVVLKWKVPVVSFTFGAPSPDDVERLHGNGSKVAVTVTSPVEADRAVAVGADALVVQGFEAGAHRGLFADEPGVEGGGTQYGVLSLLRLISARTDLPLVATGGLVHGADVAAVLAAGAVAAQLGTAFLRADEAGTQPAHRQALAEGGRPTAFTRAFSGRPARALVNRAVTDFSATAPSAYPEINNLTKPVRAAAGKAGDREVMSLYAGQTYELAGSGPAASIVERLQTEAREAATRLSRLR
ncbi:nitronate monooxygenase [Amycolatopsis regifaucium]|uniref:Propionate 3-nitronate monooxygenase n=1 Tax=Amycolatopsis regifaucium TaxID=546365 RepID=A0A154MNC0_9PSEU|nr:nitronate monooxygenase [Amycolatopsis regifaucium]KZB85463.1 2-nitropropane dioxygenase [Amycolatopsis regifaucium]OKA03584.1 2-nitropropane dioxygenase [Amycolatopsis regifaucium]SFJ51175.1 nitroalkane oxidase [Amycolatopsis regifaucium]